MKLFLKKLTVVLFCLLFSNIFPENQKNIPEILLNLATVNALSGGNQIGINFTAPFLSFISSAASNLNGAMLAATTAAANSDTNLTSSGVRLDGLIFNGNDLTITATTDPSSRLDVTLHTPSSGTVQIMLDDNPYTQPLKGLTIVQDQSEHTFTSSGDISLDYVLNVAGGARVTCSNAMSVLSGIGGVFIYVEDGSSFIASEILFDGNSQSAVRNLGVIEATTGDIVMQNSIGTGSIAGIDNRGTIVADVGSVEMKNNQGSDTSAAIYNNACIQAFQNISIHGNQVGANNKTIYNIGQISAQQDVEMNSNLCGSTSFALYNDAGGEIYSENHNINIINNNDIINYGTIAAPLQLTFQGNAAVNTNGITLQEAGTVQSDTIQFINNSGLGAGNGVIINGTVYSIDAIVITTDCSSRDQNVVIQVPFYLCNSNKATLFPSSNVIINNTGSCSISPTLSILGDMIVDGSTNIIAITVPGSGSVSDYISSVGDVSINVPLSGDVTINGVSYNNTIPGLTVTKSSSMIPFLISGFLAINGATTINNSAVFGVAFGMTATAVATGAFVEIGSGGSLVSFNSISLNGSALGRVSINGALTSTDAFSFTGGDIVIKNCTNSSGPAVMLNGLLQTTIDHDVTLRDNASTSAQGVLLGSAGCLQSGATAFLNNIGNASSYGLEVNGALKTNLLNITVNCASTNQAFVLDTVPMIYDNTLPLTDIVISNNGCVNAGGELQATDGTITFDGNNLVMTGTISVTGDYGVVLETPSSGTITVNSVPYVPGSITNLLIQQTNSSNNFSVGGSLNFQNMFVQNSAQITNTGSVAISGNFSLDADCSLTVDKGLTYDGGNVVGNQFANFGPIVATSGDISITRAKVNSAIFPNYIAVYVGAPITANTGNIEISNNSNINTYDQTTVVFIYDHVKAIVGNISLNGNSAAGGVAIQLGVNPNSKLDAGGSVVMDNNIGGASSNNGKAILTQSASNIVANSVEMNNNQGGTGGDACAIYHTGTILTSGNIAMSNNTVGDNGLAVYFYSGSSVHSTGGDISISNNSCVSNGDGVYHNGSILADAGSITMNGNNGGTGSSYGVFVNGATTIGSTGIIMNNNIGIDHGVGIFGTSMKTGGSVALTVSGASTQMFDSASLTITNLSSVPLPFTSFLITINTDQYGGSSGNTYSQMQTAHPSIVTLAAGNQ